MKLIHLPIVLLAAIPLSTTFYSPMVKAPENISSQGQRINKVFLYQIQPYEVKPGGTITLLGSGFSNKSNSIYIGDNESVSAISANGINMTAVLPASIKEGEYEVSVVNNLGVSRNPNIKILLKVTNSPVSPAFVSRGIVNNGVVTLTGSGFSRANTVVTSLGQISNIQSSDGKTLAFNLSELPNYAKVKDSLKKSYILSLAIYVQNEHGISTYPYMLNFSL